MQKVLVLYSGEMPEDTMQNAIKSDLRKKNYKAEFMNVKGPGHKPSEFNNTKYPFYLLLSCSYCKDGLHVFSDALDKNKLNISIQNALTDTNSKFYYFTKNKELYNQQNSPKHFIFYDTEFNSLVCTDGKWCNFEDAQDKASIKKPTPLPPVTNPASSSTSKSAELEENQTPKHKMPLYWYKTASPQFEELKKKLITSIESDDYKNNAQKLKELLRSDSKVTLPQEIERIIDKMCELAEQHRTQCHNSGYAAAEKARLASKAVLGVFAAISAVIGFAMPFLDKVEKMAKDHKIVKLGKLIKYIQEQQGKSLFWDKKTLTAVCFTLAIAFSFVAHEIDLTHGIKQQVKKLDIELAKWWESERVCPL